MKKTLCIILSAVLIISACIFSVNAVTVPQIDTSPSIDMPEFVYCEEGFNILYQFDDPSGITRTFCYLCSGQNPDGSNFTLLADYGGSVYCGDAVKYYELDGYTLVSPREYLPGYYYILADGKMSELSYAYEHGMFDSDALYNQLIKCDDKPGVWSKNANLIVTSPRVSSITFTDNFGWGQMYVYAWDSDGKSIDGAYPGSPITNKKINSYGETQFVYNLPENAAGIIISNGIDSRSEEITDFSRYGGYWFSGIKNSDDYYVPTGYIVSEEPTFDPNATEPDTSIYTPVPTEPEVLPTDGGPEYSEIMRKKVSEASIYSNIESDKIEIQIKDSSEGMAYAEDYNENDGNKFLEDFKDYGIISVEEFYIDFAYYRAFVTLDKKDRKNVIDTCLELFDNPLVIAATPVTTHGEVHFEKGDVNADEALDIIDAVNIQKFTVDRIGFRDEQKSFGDYNNDGICDILDSTAIQKALVAE